MRPPTSDPTAGERARAIGAYPAAVHPIPDPTDPRVGAFPGDAKQRGSRARRIVDPTDPACGGELSA
jgi:hypothetical protein